MGLIFRKENESSTPASVKGLWQAYFTVHMNTDLSLVRSDGNLSESEAELDGEHNEVTLPQDLPGRGNTKSAKSAIR